MQLQQMTNTTLSAKSKNYAYNFYILLIKKFYEFKTINESY